MTQNGFLIGNNSSECANLSSCESGNILKEQTTILKLDVEDVMSDWDRMVRFDALEYYKPDLSSPSNQTSNSNNGSSSCVSPTSSSSSRSSFNSSKSNMKYNLDNVQFRASPPCTSTFPLSSSTSSSGKSFKFHETRFASKTKPVSPFSRCTDIKKITKPSKCLNSRTNTEGKEPVLKFVFHNVIN